MFIMKNQWKGSLCLLLCTTIWGFAFIAQSVGMDLIGPFTFQFVRGCLAIGFLIPCSFLLECNQGGFTESVKRWKNPELWRAGLICGIALFIAASLQQIGLVYTDAGKAGFITAMYIVLVPILGIFLHRKPPKTAFFSVILAVIGLYLLCCIGNTQINKGDLLLIGCALTYAVQIHCVDYFAPNLDGLRLNCIQCLVVIVLSLPCALLSETIDVQNIWACRLPLLFAGVVSMGIAYTLQIIGQKDVEPTAASLIMSLESVIAVLAGWLILHETMSPSELLGCVLVFTAVIISQLPEKKK